MGILRLMQFVKKKAPSAITTTTLKELRGEIIACDASMAMYQFLIATQNIRGKNTYQSELS